MKPLWMPSGSVRAIIALLVTVAVVWKWLAEGVFDGQMALATGVVWGFYFGTRSVFKDK